MSGTLNWLLVCKLDCTYEWDTVTVNQLVIVSLHLGIETYKQLLMPTRFDQVSKEKLGLAVLRECLCSFHDYKGTYFVVWQMKEFGFWIQRLLDSTSQY